MNGGGRGIKGPFAGDRCRLGEAPESVRRGLSHRRGRATRAAMMEPSASTTKLRCLPSEMHSSSSPSGIRKACTPRHRLW